MTKMGPEGDWQVLESEAKKADLRGKPRRASGESQLQRRFLEVFSGRGTEGRTKNGDEGAGA